MPKLLQINVDSALYSCGKICEDISRVAQSEGWDTYVAYGRERAKGVNKEIRIGSWAVVYMHWALQRIFDNEGHGSRNATKKLIKNIEELHPDIIHLHLIHDHYLNYPILFDYLSKSNIPVVWTQHDSWNFTGHCYHFVAVNCNKWKSECYDCPLIHRYPNNLLDRSRKNFNHKKESFLRLNNLIIVSCSRWLDSFVSESFFKNKRHVVIHNGIDVNRFRPTKEKNKDKFQIIGVSLPWTKAKGIEDFYQLRQQLPEKEYDILMVGLSSKQLRNLPHGIIGVERTHNIEELVDLYSSSHVLVNTTYADNYPTINLEALSCGTPVITYNTGGSPESLNSNVGRVVPQGDINALIKAIKELKDNQISVETCRQHAVDNFDRDKCYKEYLKLYNELLSDKNG